MAEQNQDKAQPTSCIDKLTHQLFSAIECFYQKIGLMVGKQPGAFMLAAILIFILACAGFLRFETETREEKLWVPSGTQASRDKDFIDGLYVKFARFEDMIVSGLTSNQNMLKPEVLDYIYDLHMRVMSVEADNPESKDGKSTLVFSLDEADDSKEAMCFRRGPGCFQTSIIDIFSGDSKEWETEEKILAKINSGNVTNNVGEQVDILTILGGTTTKNGRIIAAQAIASAYFIVNNEVVSDSNEVEDKQGEAWEDSFLNFLADESAAASERKLRIDRFAARSFADEFGGSIDNDVFKLQIATFLLLVYTFTMLSRWSEGFVGMRLILALGGFISIGMAAAGALGIGSAFGLFYSPLMNVFPFLLIGIGVDDIFVVVSAYDQTPDHMPVSERLSLSLGRSGSSITITTLTNFCAFLIGSNTTLPALKSFSIFAALGILLTLVFQVLFFSGVLALDEQLRRQNRRFDVLCCIKANGELRGCGTDKLMENILGKIANLFSIGYVKIVVLLLFGALAGGGIAGIIKMEVDADVDDFIPPDSYLSDWSSIRSDLYTTIGDSTGVYMQDVEFSSPLVQQQMTELYQAFASDPTVAESTVKSWYEEFKAYHNGETIPEDEFYSLLQLWLSTSPMLGGGSNFSRDVLLKSDNSGIKSCRFTGNHVQTQESRTKVKQMDSLRATVQSIPEPLGSNSFAFGENYVQVEQYKLIGKEALLNIGLALLMVFVVIAILLVNPLASILTFLSIGLAVLELVGYMHWWGLSIDNVVVIFIVISLGLSVDYSAHIAHAFVASSGTSNERMFKALTELGPAVINGALSTFVAVLVISFSVSYVFVVFFKALFLCVVLGLAHGLILLPVAMSILLPSVENPAPAPTKTAELVSGSK